MAFPPNYNQDRTNRDRNKARKMLDKQQKREEKAAQRKAERPAETEIAPIATVQKEQE
jgi:hypothetical protein